MKRTRQEHLMFCKKRALECVEAGDLSEAFASMASDLSKHPETEGHSGISLGMAFLYRVILHTRFWMGQIMTPCNRPNLAVFVYSVIAILLFSVFIFKAGQTFIYHKTSPPSYT